ncbi:IS1634 family transposase [Coleofasciculus sp. LEGE 07081]|uniref:IS1634 family transposase n=1 Tax=Coleofasciculus sp. LEGE 07081 TaxID=2777967 RepID=UPI00187F0961|nr:IS1634 family transposase [Coleofasciculus sp. LEGE 07081]MBE9130228.1 IS1634 family transposase [Coleofasciculus sp. LEGE 07081]
MDIQVETINHLGLVAGIIDEIGIEDIINKTLGIDKREKLTAGQVVKAIILNGLGFVSRPLYLFSQFFKDKATEHLLGEGIEAKHLNDDKIGRVMDELYAYGLSNLFLIIALAAQSHYGVSTEFSHLDATSFSLHGKYESELIPLPISSSNNQEESPVSQPKPIQITHGYSRDRRADLKQFILDLIVSGDGDVPLFIRVADGNETDKAAFGQIASYYKSQVNFETMIVSDSALYTDKNLKLMSGIEWLCRVPLSIKEARNLVSSISSEQLNVSEIPGYSWVEVKSNYGGVEQRWLVVESEQRKASNLEKLEKKIKQEEGAAEKKLVKLFKKEFESEEEARARVNEFEKKLKFHQLEQIQVIEIPSAPGKKGNKSQSKKLRVLYQITGSLKPDEKKIEALEKRAGRFVLATNRLDYSSLTSAGILRKYKEQQAPERGFAFLKDPLFFADSVFLKSPQRIETMAMLMGLCLLVYSLGQRQLRLKLSEENTGLKNQLGKLTDRPTLRWIFQTFQGIHLVFIQGVKQIVNLTDERQLTLSFFPQSCQNYYILSG